MTLVRNKFHTPHTDSNWLEPIPSSAIGLVPTGHDPSWNESKGDPRCMEMRAGENSTSYGG